MINLLFTSVGRRIELIQQFKKAMINKKIPEKIICVYMNEISPALYYADFKYLVPSIYDEGYIDCLINICKKEKITMIIPTIDTELRLLAKKKKMQHICL